MKSDLDKLWKACWTHDEAAYAAFTDKLQESITDYPKGILENRYSDHDPNNVVRFDYTVDDYDVPAGIHVIIHDVYTFKAHEEIFDLTGAEKGNWTEHFSKVYLPRALSLIKHRVVTRALHREIMREPLNLRTVETHYDLVCRLSKELLGTDRVGDAIDAKWVREDRQFLEEEQT